MNRRRHRQPPARILLALAAMVCSLIAALGQPESSNILFETREFPVDASALRYNLNDLTNWGIGPATFPAISNFVIIEHSPIYYGTGFGAGGFGNAGFGSNRFTRLIPAPPETVNREFQSAFRQHFARAGLDLGTNTGKSIAFDSARQTFTITAPSAELDAIAAELKKIGRYIPEVNLKMKVVALPLLSREPDDLQALDRLGIHHRFTVESGGVSLDRSNTVTHVQPFFVHLSDTGYHKALLNLASSERDEILTAPEVTSESLRRVQLDSFDLNQIMARTSVPRTPTFLQQFHAALQKFTGAGAHHYSIFVLDCLPAISGDESSIQLKHVSFSLSTYPSSPWLPSTNPPPPITVSLPFPDLTIADQATICIGNFVTDKILIDYNPYGPPGTRALANKKTPKHILLFLTATLVNPDGTRYHTNTIPPSAQK